jgi:hypothetical protein
MAYRRLPDDWKFPVAFSQGERHEIAMILPASWTPEQIETQQQELTEKFPFSTPEIIIGPVETPIFAWLHMVMEAE